ncbi:MAG: hypothetical protein ACHQQQ_14030 [Bacteroidota bacterium]
MLRFVWNFVIASFRWLFSRIDKHHTIIEVFLTAIAIWVAWLLLNRTSDQVIEMQKADSIAQSSLDLANRQFTTINRPWVIVENIELSSPTITANTYCRFQIKNIGNLPAQNVDMTNGIIYSMVKELDTAPLYLDHEGWHHIGPIVPGHGIQDSTRTFNSKEIKDILAGKAFLYGYAIQIYSDAVGSKDTTTFCAKYDVNFGGFIIYEKYNDVK